MIRNTTLVAVLGLALGAAGCDVDQTREGELPEVEVREGQMPQYDVDTAEVETGTERRTVEVPDIDVDTEQETIEVPTVDIVPPEEDGE